MAIKWTTYRPNSSEVVSTKVTHEGLVVSESWTREVRVMSDVYCDAAYVLVWNPETKQTETVCLGHYFELCSTFGTATKDADAVVLAEVARQQAEAAAKAQAAEQARREALAKAHAEKLRNTPEVGKVMVVARGRKVPVGTVGKVFWLRDGRVGLALDDTKDARGYHAHVAWVDACYLQAA